jgi:Ca2+/H+ antiporter, TMEM165/GDT1 family
MKRFSRKKLILLSPFFIIAFAAFIFLFGWVVMLLWNAVMVPAAGAGIITFWQALGLLVLSRILVGGFGGRGRRRGNFCNEKWDNMSEERKAAVKEKFKQRWESRFPDGPTENEAAESK